MVEQGVFIKVGGWDTAKKREGGIWNSVRAVGRGTKRVEEVCRQINGLPRVLAGGMVSGPAMCPA